MALFGIQMTIIIHSQRLNKRGDKSMYENSLNLLESKGIVFEKGLSLDELIQIEEIYQITFPKSLREFLMTALPISRGFYNWRDITEKNINFIRQVINKPITDIIDMAEEVYWCDDWGEEPEDEESIAKEVRERIKKAPNLVPIYAHRYMPMISEDNPPVISIHNIDIIYFGKDLEDYFEVEFGEKGQDKIDFQNIADIPFWSEIM